MQYELLPKNYKNRKQVKEWNRNHYLRTVKLRKLYKKRSFSLDKEALTSTFSNL